jgi:hypothetical protein
MWHGFIGQRIAATNKTLHRSGIALLAVALALCAYGARTFINVKQGPAKFDEAQLAAIKDPNLQLRNFVTVEGRNTISTGITAIEKTTRNGVVESQRTTGEYMAMTVGKHILVVKAKPGDIRQKYTGTITSLQDDLKKEVFSDLADPDLQAATFHLLLDTTVSYGDELILGYIVVGALVLSGLWMFFLSERRNEMPERHPLCKALSQYGPLYSVVPQIDSDVAAGTSSFNSATFSRNWIISCWLTEVAVMRRDEIIWAYKKRTKHSVNLIPTGSSYSLVLRDARGKLLELPNSEQLLDSYLASWVEQTPWVIFGYDRKLEKLYKKQLQSFAQTVSDRRSTMQAHAAKS